MIRFEDFIARWGLEADGRNAIPLPVGCPRCLSPQLTVWRGRSQAAHLSCANGCHEADRNGEWAAAVAAALEAAASQAVGQAVLPDRASQAGQPDLRADREGQAGQPDLRADLQNRTFLLGVNRAVRGKLPKDAGAGAWQRLNHGFKTERLDVAGLAQAIRAGHAITAVHQTPDGRDAPRKREHFASAQIIGLDFDSGDGRSSLDALMGQPLIRLHAALIHTTSSSTPAAPRARVLFVLDRPVTGWREFADLAAALVAQFPAADQGCADPSRLWFGAVQCELRVLGGVLPVDTIRRLPRGAVGQAVLPDRGSQARLPDVRGRGRWRQELESRAPIAGGKRNTSLASIAGGLRAQGLSEAEILEALKPVNARRCQPPLAPAELRSIARGMMRYPAGGRSGSRPDLREAGGRSGSRPDLEAGGGSGGRSGRHPDLQGEGRRALRPSHDELAARWVRAHPQIAHGLGAFRRYQGGAWLEVDDNLIQKEVLATLVQAKDEGVRPTAGLLASVLRLIEVEVSPPSRVWDAQPDLVPLANGVLHLPSLELHPHAREHYLTHCLEYPYDPQAAAPVFESVLADAIPEARDFFLEFAGYALTGDTSLETCIWLVGPPGCGKSTLIAALEALLGPRCGVLGLAELVHNRFSLSKLPGKTLLVSTEQPGDFMQSTHLLNQIISGEAIEVDRKFKEALTVRPQAKVIWAMNEPPRLSASNGLMRRVKVIELPPLDEALRRPGLKQAFLAERAGILNLAAEAYRRLRARGRFELPSGVRQATDQLREMNDVARAFVEECCWVGAGYRALGGALYSAYRDWCLANGHRPKSSTMVAEDWRRLGFERSKSHGKPVWSGVGLRSAGG